MSDSRGVGARGSQQVCTDLSPPAGQPGPRTIYRLAFALAGLPEMGNVWGRIRSPRKQNRHQQSWERAAAAMVGARKPPKPLKFYHLKLRRFSSSEPDWDGLAMSFKPIVDGLVAAGVLEDDKLSNTGRVDCWWEPVKQGEGHITVEVTERSQQDGETPQKTPRSEIEERLRVLGLPGEVRGKRRSRTLPNLRQLPLARRR